MNATATAPGAVPVPASDAPSVPIPDPAAGPVPADATGPASAAVSAEGVLDDLDAAFAASGEAIALIERDSRRLLWCSGACRALHPAIETGGSASVVPGIDAVLDAVEAGEPVRSRDATLVHASGDRVTVRLHPNRTDRARTGGERPDGTPDGTDVRSTVPRRPADDYLQRYVADRERLFMVSRTVSVSEMATTLAHELNQPIGTIANLLQGLQVLLAREREPVPEPIARALTHAADQTRFVAGIVARIRSFTEARAPRLVACDLARVVAGTVELLDWVFRSEDVAVELDAPTETLCVSGDEILLQQVFANLLRNAVDAMRERPADERRIRVTVARDPDGIAVRVRDHGTGLGEDAADTLFVPFASTKRDGMGVGLNICRSFVEMHRGRLWLTGAPGGGCTAHVSLPERVGDRPAEPTTNGTVESDGAGGANGTGKATARATTVRTAGGESGA